MALANLSTVIPLIAILVFVFYFLVHGIYKNRAKAGIKISIFFFIGLIPTILSVFWLLKLRSSGALYYGTMDGFWNLTVKTLFIPLTGINSNSLFITIIVLAVFLIISYFFSFYKNPAINFLARKENFSIEILFISTAGIILSSVIFNVNYPEDRVGLYLFPLFLLSIVFALDKIIEEKKTFVFYLVLLPLLYFPVHFLINLNFSYANFYKNDHIPEQFYDRVKSFHKEDKHPPTIGGYRTRHFCWSYYDFLSGGTQNQVYWSGYPGNVADFQIADTADKKNWLETYEIIENDNITGRHLLKRKKFLEKTELKKHPGISSEIFISDEFFGLLETDASMFIGQTLYLTYNLNIQAETKPFTAWIVVEVLDKNNKQLMFEFLSMDWLRTSWQGEANNLVNGQIIGKIPRDATTVKTYIWNIHKTPFKIGTGEIILYKYEISD